MARIREAGTGKISLTERANQVGAQEILFERKKCSQNQHSEERSQDAEASNVVRETGGTKQGKPYERSGERSQHGDASRQQNHGPRRFGMNAGERRWSGTHGEIATQNCEVGDSGDGGQ